jgi:transposase
MFVETIKNRSSPPCTLLRESYRDEGKVRHRTLANLSTWPDDLIFGLRELLKNHRAGNPVTSASEGFRIERSIPHGHVQAVVSTIERLKLDHLIGSKRCPERDRVIAMIAARILNPASKLATTRALNAATCSNTLAEACGIDDDVHENDLYDAMDWLLKRQARIEKSLASRHLQDGSLVLYDLTSSYFEGTTCPLAKLGYSRDGKKGKLQIVFGLLCDSRGCPLAVEVFDGNTADPSTVGKQIEKILHRFGLKRVVMVGDRGMLTQARIDEELRPIEGLDWISALRSSQISSLVESSTIQMELFDQRNLAEISSPDFPGERLVVCRNPALAARRSHKREALLTSTEAKLEKIRLALTRAKRPLRGKDKIGLSVGRKIDAHKMAKHFIIQITDDSLAWQRDEEKIRREAATDGLYVVRTSLPTGTLSADDIVERYKDLSAVENAFRSIKTVDLKVRPINHYNADRVRCHIFLCMLAYYIEWHMRQALKPLLFDEDDPEAARLARTDVVSPKEPSPSARAKANGKKTPGGLPVHSFQTLLADLATITRNTIVPKLPGATGWQQDTEPTALQTKILELLATHPMP